MPERRQAHHAETGRFLSEYDLTAAFTGRGGEVVPATAVQTPAAGGVPRHGSPCPPTAPVAREARCGIPGPRPNGLVCRYDELRCARRSTSTTTYRRRSLRKPI